MNQYCGPKGNKIGRKSEWEDLIITQRPLLSPGPLNPKNLIRLDISLFLIICFPCYDMPSNYCFIDFYHCKFKVAPPPMVVDPFPLLCFPMWVQRKEEKKSALWNPSFTCTDSEYLDMLLTNVYSWTISPNAYGATHPTVLKLSFSCAWFN